MQEPQKEKMITLEEINKIERKQTRFSKFFSNVSFVSVADTVPIETQVVLLKALREVE